MKKASILLLFSLAVAPASAAIDPFYRARMESGIAAFEQGDLEEAEHQLRIACFGYLEEPVALAEGLVRLALVETLLGDEPAFQRVFSRLAELEEQFGAYGSATLPEPLRRRFESQAARLVPVQSLRATEGFRAIAERADIQRIGSLPPERRRAELEAKMAEEPERVDWLLEMARLELAVRRPQAALDWLDRVPAEAAGVAPVTCLRQQAASESGACDRMDLAEPFCRDVPPDVVEFRLQCLVEAARWPEAASLVADLSPELRARRRVTRLERRVRKNLEPAAEVSPEPAPPVGQPVPVQVPAPTPPAAPEAQPPAAEPSPPAAEPRPSATAVGLEPPEIEELRRRLAAAETSAELAALRGEADELAERHPESRRAHLLAAEVAYLQSDWPAAVREFRLAGELRADEAHLAFYQAVALYESGDPEGAAAVLRPVASTLQRTGFVAAYLDRILGPDI